MDSERGRDKERGKERSWDKEEDREREREREREKLKEHGRVREKENDRHQNVFDREKGKESFREEVPDQDGERQRERDKNTDKHWGEDLDKSKCSTKDGKSGSDTIADQGTMDLSLLDIEDGMVTENQQHVDGGVAASRTSASELENHIMKREKKD